MPFLPGLSRSRSSSSSHALPIQDEAKKGFLVFGILGSSKLELDSLYFRSYPITPRIHPFIPRRTVTTTLPTTPSPCYLSSKLQHFYTVSSLSILLLLLLLLISSPTYHHFTRLTKAYHMQFPSLPQALVLSITHIRHLFNLP